MEPCNRVAEWLEQSSPPNLSNIPVHLSDHLSTCSECKKTVSFFLSLSRDENYPNIPSSEVNEFVIEFQRKALEIMPESTSPPLSAAHSSFCPKFAWFFAGAVGILLLAFASSFFFQSSPTIKQADAQTFAVLNGKASLVAPPGDQSASVPGSAQPLSRETEIQLNSPPEPVVVQYKNGGKILLSGIGRMKVLKDGLNVESGSFNAQFKNLEGTLHVRVPCAVLGIKGTEIQFKIQPPTGEILLVEGIADLTPDNPSHKPFRLEKGKSVLLADNTWTISRPESPPSPPIEKKKPAPPGLVASNTPPSSSVEKKNNIPHESVASGSHIPENPGDETGTSEEIASDSMLETNEEPVAGREGFGP
jgi:hypothetical protein